MLFPIVPLYGATGASLIAALPVPEGVKTAAAVPLLLMPIAFVYQENIKALYRRGTETLVKLRSYLQGKKKNSY